MDLTNSYWQIELEEATKPILAFQTSQAQYVWNRLPQGTAPSMAIMAEGIMDTIQTGGIADCCTCYVDNIIVASESLEQHKKDLERSVKVFEKRGWKANPAKSHVYINTECRLYRSEKSNNRTRPPKSGSHYGITTTHKPEIS